MLAVRTVAGAVAGPILAVIHLEMVPPSHGRGYDHTATTAFPVGYILLAVDAVIAVQRRNPFSEPRAWG